MYVCIFLFFFCTSFFFLSIVQCVYNHHFFFIFKNQKKNGSYIKTRVYHAAIIGSLLCVLSSSFSELAD